MRAIWFIVITGAGCGRIGFGGGGAGGDGGDAPRDGIGVDVLDDLSLLGYYPLDDDPSDGVENRAVGGMSAQCSTTCPDRIPSLFGGGYAFDGATTVIVLAERPELAMQRGTIAMWIRLTTPPPQGDYATLAGRAHGAGGANTWKLYMDRPSALFVRGGGDASGGSSSFYAVPYSSMGWVHVAMTWDDLDMKMYMSGVQAGLISVFPRTYDAHPTVIGADQNTGAFSQFYAGEMDEVYVFSRALGDDEIGELATP